MSALFIAKEVFGCQEYTSRRSGCVYRVSSDPETEGYLISSVDRRLRMVSTQTRQQALELIEIADNQCN